MKGLATFILAIALAGAAHAGIKIHIEGNDGLGKRKILEVIDPEPEDYSKDALRSWREDAEFYILDLYRVYGYFEATVETEMRPGSKPDAWDVIFTMREGPRYSFDSVKVTGANLRQGDETRLAPSRDSAAGPTAVVTVPRDTGAPLPLNPRPLPRKDTAAPALAGPQIDTSDLEARPGKPFRQDALFADRRYLMRRFGDAGFVRVEADDKLDIRRATHTVAVDYLVDPGAPVIFDTAVVRNLRAPPLDTLAGITRVDLLRGLVPYSRGDTVRMSRNDKLVEKLQYTGAFNFVRIKDSLRPDADGRSTLYLYSEEHVPGNLRSSIFYETEYGPGVSIDARHSNIAGTLNEVRAGFSVAKELQTLYAGYGSPLTFGVLVRFDDDLNFKWDQSAQSFQDTVGLFGGDFTLINSSRLTWPKSYWLRLVTDAQIEADSRMTSPITRERDLSLNFIQTAFLTFVDQPMDPAKGVRLAFSWGNGGALQRHDIFSFAEYRHNWLEAKTSHYFYAPGFSMLKFATRLDGGRFFGEGGPNSQRFFLGGSRSVRSYDFQHLCPDSHGDTACVAQDSSLAYLQASAELRAEPFWFVNPRGKLRHFAPLQIVPFIDFGRVWDVRHPVRFTWSGPKPPNGEGYAEGLGLRYPLLGIFNIRMDFVLKGSGGHRFWLDLSQAF